MATPLAALIIIGNEILSGRTQDANVQYIAAKLFAVGIRVKHVAMVSDEETDIIEAVRLWSERVDYVFTTGGIGATHDDITAEAVAKAFHTSLGLHEEAYQRLLAHYGDKFNDARKRMAYTPIGAELIDNPVSVAPGFRLRNVFVMAGVPQIAQGMLDMILPTLTPGSPWFTSTIRTTLPESLIADDLRSIQAAFAETEIGSYPYFRLGGYGVSLVVKSHNVDAVARACSHIQACIEKQGGTWIQEGDAPHAVTAEHLPLNT